MREILFDTETTGFDPYSGDRLIEIGCVNMIDKTVMKGEDQIYHKYVNPEREVPDSAVKVHGLTTDFLSDKPLFIDVVEEFLAFVGDDSVLVAHNAEFDMKFINFELEKIGLPAFPKERFIDTLAIARSKFPGQANSLDALCKRFNINNSHRTLHGALLDAEILADVYIELTVGRQAGMDLDVSGRRGRANIQKKARPHRNFDVPSEELALHAEFIETLNNPVWKG